MEAVVSIVLAVVGLYLLVGLAVGIPFVMKGAARIDPTAKEGATWGFKLLILPGVCVFWPMLLSRWRAGKTAPPEECSPHRRAACAGCAKRGDS